MVNQISCPPATIIFIAIASLAVAPVATAQNMHPLYTYTLHDDATPNSYDEVLAVACLQGLINRDQPRLYVLAQKYHRPNFWLDTLSQQGQWLAGRERKSLPSLNDLVNLAAHRVKGIVIWDPAVPATANVATTIAGVDDAIVLSPELAAANAANWHLPILHDLRDQFTGAETGSAKNDAYRWAIETTSPKPAAPPTSCASSKTPSPPAPKATSATSSPATGPSATEPSSSTSPPGPTNPRRTTPIKNSAPTSKPTTYPRRKPPPIRRQTNDRIDRLLRLLQILQHPRPPERHEGVPTEWETVWLISPYNCYQNTISSDCFNQSFHSHAPRRPLQAEPSRLASPAPGKQILPLHPHGRLRLRHAPLRFPPQPLARSRPRQIPLAWGINPNLLETYPDLIAYYYATATPADTFTADASAAGYMNPNRIDPKYLPLFIDTIDASSKKPT